MLLGARRQAAPFALCLILAACASAPKPPPPKPPPKPAAPPSLPEPPVVAKRAEPPGDGWLKKPMPHGLELGVDDPQAVARKLEIELDLRACQKNTAHWARPDAGRLKRNHTCTIEAPKLEGARQLALSFVDVGAGVMVLDALTIAFDAAEWEPRIAELEAQFGACDLTTAPATSRAWSWGRIEIQLARTIDKPIAQLRYLDHHAAHRYLARAIKTKKVPRVVPAPAVIPPASPFGIVLASDDEKVAREKLEAAGFAIGECRTLTEHIREGRVLDCPLTGTPLHGLRAARFQLADLGDGRLRAASVEYELDPARFSRSYGELERQYGPVEHELLGTENQAVWWIDPVQISMLGHARMLVVSYRHGRLAQIAANLIARSNQSAR